LVEPEQYHAMEKYLFVVVLDASGVSMLGFSMQICPLLYLLLVECGLETVENE
jgi:hypothetical protein